MTSGPVLYQFAEYIVWFFAYSFLGWCWEVSLRLVQHHVFVNRGFVTGPVLPIYGFGGLISIVLLHPIANIAVQFVVGAASAAFMEYTTSWAMEKLFHARWWDYSTKPFNLNGRIYLLGVVTFGVMMVVVDRVFQPLLNDLTDLVAPLALEIVAAAMLGVFLVDLTMSVIHMKSFNQKLEAVQGRLGELADDARKRAFEVHTAAVEAVANAKDAVQDARESASEAMERARTQLASTVEERREEAREHREHLASTAEERLREILPDRVTSTLFERRTLRDPHFVPMRNREAYAWLQKHVTTKKDA